MNTIPAYKFKEETNKSHYLWYYIYQQFNHQCLTSFRDRELQMVFIHMLPHHLHSWSQNTHGAITTRFTNNKQLTAYKSEKVHSPNSHIKHLMINISNKIWLTKHHNLNQASWLQPNPILMTYIKNDGFRFEGSGTESSRRFIPIFLEDSVTVLEKTNHIIITLTTEKRR